MTNYNLEEERLVEIQIVLSTILLFCTIISIFLSYNFLLSLKNEKTIYTDEDSYNILIFNRTVMFIVALIFILINLKDKCVKEKYGIKDDFADLQILASIFNFIATLIVLYVGINSSINITSEENPTI